MSLGNFYEAGCFSFTVYVTSMQLVLTFQFSSVDSLHSDKIRELAI